jgi:hypothetical protein
MKWKTTATGTLKPPGGPTTKFVMTEVTPLISVSDRSRLPFTTLDFSSFDGCLQWNDEHRASRGDEWLCATVWWSSPGMTTK